MHLEVQPRGESAELKVDAQNPWPGLSAFTEVSAAFFHGRDSESNDVLRLIKREPLTVLFGLSGLGKTSLLQAGLFPMLRREDFLPVYVRLSYATGSADLVTQVLEILRDVSVRTGISAPVHKPGESLWEYFHRTANEFRTGEGRLITPVLIFDQFEEMFTLGATGEGCQQMISNLLNELGDLIENRPPASVEAQIEEHGDEVFSFYKSDFKVVFTLREDFLANLESLCNHLPSIRQNRFRLQKMNGAQAYEVVLKGGEQLVDPDMAERVVKMVAGHDPQANVKLAALEVEPTLLSVFCRELNNTRVARGEERLTAQLLTGSKEAILTGFYERALSGFDERVRYFVEDKLLTGRGFRDNIALEDALEMTGVTKEAIFTLVDRRLLRIEDSSRTPRVELTHDVLTEVIRKSRDDRKAKQEAAQAEIRAKRAADQLREHRAQLKKARRTNLVLRAICAAVALFAAFSYYQYLEATTARRQAAEQKALVTKSNDAADRFIDTFLTKLRQRLNDMGELRLLDDSIAPAQKLLDDQQFVEGGMSPDQYHFEESVYQALGDVARVNAQPDVASKNYGKVLELAEKLATTNPDQIKFLEEWAVDLSGPANMLERGSAADLALSRADFASAQRFYDQSLEKTREVQAHATSPDDTAWVQRQLANIYGRQGDILARYLGDPHTALTVNYQESLDLRTKLATSAGPDDPNATDYQIDLANAYSRLALTAYQVGHFKDSDNALDKMRDIREKAAAPRSFEVNWQRQLFYTSLLIGRNELLEGRLGPKEAQQDLSSALEKEETLSAGNPQNADLQRELGFAKLFFGHYLRATGNLAGAQDSYKKCQEILGKLSVRDQTSMAQYYKAMSDLGLGDADSLTGRYGDASVEYAGAIDTMEKIIAKAKDAAPADWKRFLAFLFVHQGYAQTMQQKGQEAADNFTKARDILQEVLQHTPQEPATYNALAWLLATCPVEKVRNGAQAQALAQKACALSDGSYWGFFDTLSAADAEAQQFDRATADSQKARQQLENAGGTDNLDLATVATHLASYSKHKPVRLPPPQNLDR